MTGILLLFSPNKLMNYYL